MKRKVELGLMVQAMQDAGYEPTEPFVAALARGLKTIRREKYKLKRTPLNRPGPEGRDRSA